MAILTTSGRAALAAAVKQQALHLAIGEGDETWGNQPPSESTAQTALLREVGRRVVDEVYFVKPAADGEIVVPTGRFSISSEPTNNLFIRVRFDFEDAATSTIREQALFVGTLTNPDLPLGQKYFSPSDLVDAGILLVLENSVPIVRQPSTRETFEFVVTF
ncbi:MAG TPA: hypothetical protein PLU46_00330 [Thiotrichales bacterium]|nr:hypothetical protein [Thiotrichales bacterium]